MPRRKILFLVSSMATGGAERVAALLSNHWAGQGHHVVLMPTFSGRGECHFALHRAVQLDYLADRLPADDSQWFPKLRRLFLLRRTIREIEPDVIISFLTNVNVAALIAAAGTPVPVVVSERTYPPKQVLGLVWSILRRLLYHKARYIVAQTAVAKQWIERNCPGSRVVVIPNPVEWPMSGKPPFADPGDIIVRGRNVILAVGRLDPLKGFDILLTAFSRLASDFPAWDLIIAGEGPERVRLERLAVDNGLAGRFFLPGRVGNLGDWYKRADIQVLTSRFEGFPNVAMEALAAGVPVIAVDCPVGAREIVRHEVDGLLVPQSEGVGGVAANMARLMRDGALRTAMGARAVEAQQRFSMEKFGAEWTKVLGL